MSLRISGRDVSAMRIDGRDVVEARLNGRTVWPAVGGSWSPASVGATRPQFWMDAAHGVMGTTAVTTWQGRPEGVVQPTFTKSTRGAVSRDATGGTPKLTFTDGYLETPAAALGLTPAKTYFVVGAATGAGTDYQPFFSGSVLATRDFLGVQLSSHQVWAASASRLAIFVIKIPITAEILLRFEADGAGGVLAVDGGRLSSPSGKVPNAPTGNFLIGGHLNNPALYGVLRGHIREIIAYNGVPSAAEIARIEGYLAHKYGLAGNLPAAHPYKAGAP